MCNCYPRTCQHNEEELCMRRWHVSQGDHCGLTKFQNFDFVITIFWYPFTFIFNDPHYMPFPLGNIVGGFKDENVYNGSLFKQNKYLEKKSLPLCNHIAR